jgi:hypothetical protein
VTSFVSGSLRGLRRAAALAYAWLMSWADHQPLVTGVVRCNPVVRGPEVAPMWPSGHELGKRVPMSTQLRGYADGAGRCATDRS